MQMDKKQRLLESYSSRQKMGAVAAKKAWWRQFVIESAAYLHDIGKSKGRVEFKDRKKGMKK